VSGSLRVLVLVQGPLGRRLAGPEIRGWEVARAFAAAGHRVTVAADVAAAQEREGIPLVPRTRRNILVEMRRHDAVVGPVIPPYALLTGHRCVRVADLYDPVDLEVATVGGWRSRRHVAGQLRSRGLQLRWSDLLVCANQRQLDRMRTLLADIPRPGGPPEIVTVPMGLPAPPEPVSGHALREHFPAIAAGDPVILWWGSVWRWLDAGTAVEAVGLLARRRPDVRLVISAGRPSNAATDPLNVAEDVRALARERGLLDRHVFFLDEWIPYEERHRILGDADVGITLHAGTAEATLAARARYMDYVWCTLPAVLAEGDEVADRLARGGAARLVAPGDAEGTARVLEDLLGEPGALEAARGACRAIAAEFRWSQLLEPLVRAVEDTRPGRRSLLDRAALSGEAARYYARRAVDRGLTVIPAR
jgi:glycosyltransferase involved in cell wall biosynthesis